MRSSSQCERGAAQRAMSRAHNSALMLGVLLISCIPITTSAPVLLNPSSIEHEQLLTQTSDVLEDLCFRMLGSLQKSKEITARETRKRSTVLHPLLELIPHLARRRSRRMKLNDDLQGPGRIQSRGFFLYRPRNGRRSDEYV
ncbi:neuromedin-U-like isoform X5 [Carassius carassius]|uniref:neuromedin-U-like isoform X5 n=1 Tax=Carassius carassius TaxID=217509 RepID=UPI002868BB28|nr:neuromedin-U-like isoform X5 [Carassius carassius]